MLVTLRENGQSDLGECHSSLLQVYPTFAAVGVLKECIFHTFEGTVCLLLSGPAPGPVLHWGLLHRPQVHLI